MTPPSCFISLFFACVSSVYILYVNSYMWNVSTPCGSHRLSDGVPSLFSTSFVEAKSHMYELVEIVHLTLGIPSPPSKAEGDHAHLRFVWALEYRNLVFTPSCQEHCALSLVPSHVLISVLSCICTQA